MWDENRAGREVWFLLEDLEEEKTVRAAWESGQVDWVLPNCQVWCSSSPQAWAPGTGFLEDSFPTEQGWGDGFGMVQEHCIQAHPLL